MSKRIVLRPKANQDLDDHVAYIAEQSSETALNFFDAVRFTIAQLARMPGMGMGYPVRNPRLEGLRKWAVKGFKKYIIFYIEYIERDGSIEITRTLYGARDINSILERKS